MLSRLTQRAEVPLAGQKHRLAVADQPAARRMAWRNSPRPAPVLAETAMARDGGMKLGRRSTFVVDIDTCHARGDRLEHRRIDARVHAPQGRRPRARARTGCAPCRAVRPRPATSASGRIDQHNGHAVDVYRLAQRVARRSWNRRDDRALFAREAVEQARFAHVRSSGEHGVDTAAQQAALPAASETSSRRAAHARKPLCGVIAVERVELLLGKVELRLRQGA